MTEAVAQILANIERLSLPDRVELADRLIPTLVESVPPEIERAQLDEVRRRIAEVETGAVKLIPGEEALGQVRRLVASVQTKR